MSLRPSGVAQGPSAITGSEVVATVAVLTVVGALFYATVR